MEVVVSNLPVPGVLLLFRTFGLLPLVSAPDVAPALVVVFVVVVDESAVLLLSPLLSQLKIITARLPQKSTRLIIKNFVDV